MFDFSNLDPEIITRFWIYCVVFFVIGLGLGWSVRVVLTKIASDNFHSERERFMAEKASLVEIKGKYESLCKDLKENDEYWLYKKQQSTFSTSHDDDPSKLLHKGLK